MIPDLYFILALCLWILLSAVVMVILCMLASRLSRREEAVKLDRERDGLPR